MDAGFSKSYRNGSHASTSPHAPGTLPPDLPGCNSRRRIIPGGYQKRTAQSPREERCLQTSCSLPETPIFARGYCSFAFQIGKYLTCTSCSSCDIPRTPHRRAPEVPPHSSGSRTAPRTNTNTTSSLGSSVVGIGKCSKSLLTPSLSRDNRLCDYQKHCYKKNKIKKKIRNTLYRMDFCQSTRLTNWTFTNSYEGLEKLML